MGFSNGARSGCRTAQSRSASTSNSASRTLRQLYWRLVEEIQHPKLAPAHHILPYEPFPDRVEGWRITGPLQGNCLPAIKYIYFPSTANFADDGMVAGAWSRC